MKAEDAIDVLWCTSDSRNGDAVKKAVNALWKQVAKKPTRNFLCPNCYKKLPNVEGFKYCVYCGQKIGVARNE